MTRLVPPDGACHQMEVITSETGARMLYPMQADGTMHVDNKNHERALRQHGAFTAAGQPARASGWRCPSCEFLGWFRTCGRCGATCERET